jgi:predicted DNA-binding protein
MSRKVTTTIYITEDQQKRLKELNSRSKVPIAEYIREGIDLVLDKHKDQLPGQMDLAEQQSDSNKEN